SYAMACAYLDSLAHYRRGRNLPATSIHWGALGQVGMAARYADVEKYLSGSGVGSFTPSQAVKLFGRILHWNPVELGVAIMDWKLWGRIYPTWAASPKYGALIVNEEGTGAESADPTRLRALFNLDPEAREAAIADVLTELLAQTLGSAPDKIDRGLSLLSMGIDSLMAMDLQTAVEKRLAVKISMLELMKGNSVTQLAQHVALTIAAPRAATHAPETCKPTRDPLHQRALRDELDLGDAGKIMAQLNDLTDDEVGRLFDKLLPKEAIEQ
ncbi:MAG: phosphopantetheine-binding protein, partial [Burkholderiales bacterium]